MLPGCWKLKAVVFDMMLAMLFRIRNIRFGQCVKTSNCSRFDSPQMVDADVDIDVVAGGSLL